MTSPRRHGVIPLLGILAALGTGSATGDETTVRAERLPGNPIIRPETTYERGDLPVTRSKVGNAHGPEHGVRDPFAFKEAGKTYLLYSVAGDSGIAIAALHSEIK